MEDGRRIEDPEEDRNGDEKKNEWQGGAGLGDQLLVNTKEETRI